MQLKNDKTGEVITVDLYNCPSLYLEENVTVKYLKHTKKKINEILIPKLLVVLQMKTHLIKNKDMLKEK